MGDDGVKIVIGKTVEAGGRKSESYQTLNFSFKPTSAKNQRGVLWKEKGASGKSKKVVLQYSSSEAGAEGSGQSYNFEGSLDTGGAYDYVLIMEPDGTARLEKLAGNAKMQKLNATATLPKSKAPPLPASVKQKYNLTSSGTPPRPNKIQKTAGGRSSSEEDSDSDSDDSGPGTSSRAPAPAPQPSGGGKGMMGLGGKGLLTKDMMQGENKPPSSDSEESNSSEDESDSDD